MTRGRTQRLALMAGESGCRARTRADFLCVQVSCYVQSYSSLLCTRITGVDVVDIGCAVGIVSNVLQRGWGHRRNVGTRV
eukprot:COSAG06_NODE_2862_length_6156_cov_37.661165_1_plen_79_part_10